MVWSLATILLIWFSLRKGLTVSEPRNASYTVIGGGAIGCAVAYRLAREGFKDIQLLERDLIGCATSSQAAGFVGQARTTPERTRLAMTSAQFYARMESETGFATDWRPTGSVRIATSPDRLAELHQIAAVAERSGLDVELVSPSRLTDLVPVLNPRDVIAALWCPSDGYVQPTSLTTAYAGAARELGVTIAPRTAVHAVEVSDGSITAVLTDRGRFHTENVVIAAGPWSAVLAGRLGIELPIIPVRHEYFVTEPVEGWTGALPCVRLVDHQLYFRGEVGSILCGGFESAGASLDPRVLAPESSLPNDPDWEVLGGFATQLAPYCPEVMNAGVRAVFRGWPGFTPDGRFVVGPVTSIRGLSIAAGCNAHGVSGSAGLAQHLVESLGADPSPYVRSLSPMRFMPPSWNWEDARREAQTVYEEYYQSRA
jgi:glycine/D-amino acid oxidase-like deaminating enzyme